MKKTTHQSKSKGLATKKKTTNARPGARQRAIAKDLRVTGRTLIFTGIAGSAFRAQVPVAVSIAVGIIGLILVSVGVWLTADDESGPEDT